MKLENLTIKLKFKLDTIFKSGFLSALFILCSFGQASAQCPLGCNNSVQISLDTDCSVEITPDVVLEGQGTTGCNYIVTVMGPNNQPIPGSPMVDGAWIGQTLNVRVSLGANSCWGTITIEDKLPPQIDCLDDITISCYESSDVAPPTATDNCDVGIQVVVLEDVINDLDCADDYSASRTITYQATDASGNESELCVRTVFFERISLMDIVFPMDRDDVELPSLECDNIPQWDDNGDGYPQPEETGTPMTIDGFNIFPNNSFCELNATFSDQVLPICESSFKVLRTWTVLDWCTGEVVEDFQIVKVEDNENPIVTCVPDNPAAVSADPYTCTGTWLVPDPIVIFDCSSTTYTVGYLTADNNGDAPVNGIYIDDDVVENSNGTFTLTNLQLGRTWVRYTITDACGNVEFCFTEIDVVDDVPPVPVCDEFTVVTLTVNGGAHIFAQSFDDGSHDNCSDVTFDVRRMTPGCGASTTVFSEFVEFCCDDIGEEVMVSLRVTDANGNSNTCMVIVDVQDKLDPVITCPNDITVDCGTDTEDFNNTGGMATATDNCGDVDVTVTTSGSVDQCGVGTLFRTFRATDAGGRSVTCRQRITVIDSDPFTLSDITFPNDRTLNGCVNIDTDPSNTGRPTFDDDICSLVADTYEDQVFSFVDDACLKILRTWTVIDWCTFDQNNPNGGGIYSATQIIKVSNGVDPVFDGCTNLTVEAFGENCNGFAEIIVNATDDCTPAPELLYEYTIDQDSDGIIDFFGSSNDASRTLPVGLHTVYFTVEDQCGNQEDCSFTVNVVDRKKPTPYCLSEITTVIMPSTGEISIWANDFDLGSFDNCPGEVLISFSSNTNNIQRFFNCDQIGLNEVEIWVTDASGNQDFCTTTIDIQDNGGCSGSRIGGVISTQSDDSVSDVMVTMTNMASSETQIDMTPTSGSFQFLNPQAEISYELTAEKDVEHNNGVSTLDLVLIQRHILGLQALDSPYKVIAADVTGNEVLNASDLLELRKLILGINIDFQNNSSWRFVDANQTFNDISEPFPFTEEIMVFNFNQSDIDNHFVAVKIGDVNGSAIPDNVQDTEVIETRNGNTIELTIANQEFSRNDIVTIPVTASNFDNLLGFQFTLEANNLELIDVIPGALNVSSDNFGVFSNELTASWSTATEISTQEDEVLFTLEMRAKTNNNLNNTLALTSSITNAEAYDASLEINDIEIVVRDGNESNEQKFEVFQNTPNPFDGVTSIPFVLPQSGTVSVNIFDITGKVVYSSTSEYTKGANEVRIENTDLNSKGIMYYQVEFNGKVVTNKMISL